MVRVYDLQTRICVARLDIQNRQTDRQIDRYNWMASHKARRFFCGAKLAKNRAGSVFACNKTERVDGKKGFR